ncbi:MAG TPA: FeoA family protein [Thermoanaerobaculia bacterium]|nr:FeoA family protein [Thermoanaerobaculia bacterium]
MRRGLKKAAPETLADLRRGEEGTLEALDLPAGDARRLMELGFVPGTRVAAGRSAPGGDPRVFRVDGSEIALRKATARHIRLRPAGGTAE